MGTIIKKDHTQRHMEQQAVCLTEFFEDHLFGSDTIIDEIEEKEHFKIDFPEETAPADDFDEWFQQIMQDGHRFAKRPKHA